jgi:hypothetical protein
MRADRDDRITAEDRQRRHSTQTLLMAIAVLILAGGAYLLAPGDEDETPAESSTPPVVSRPPPSPPQPEPDAAIRAAPDIPEAEAEPVSDAADSGIATVVAPSIDEAASEVIEAPVEATELPAAPTPEELDGRLRRAIADAGLVPAEAIAGSLSAPYLFDRGVSSADQLARGLVPRRTLNLPRPQGRFEVQREGEQYRVDPRSYRRYDPIVAAITALPVKPLASLFQTFRTELSEAYASLGYPEDAMDNTIIAALDAVIGAPVVEGEPLLVTRGALWAYADADLESASDLHRQLMRTGPANTRALKDWAGQLREALLNP